MPEAQVVYQAKKFKVQRRTIASGDGRSRAHEFISHPGAAVILPLLGDGRIVLIRNMRPTVQRELLEIPAGTIEPPEAPVDCARRELIEETGYVPGRIEPLTSFYSSPGICDELMHAFLATDLKSGPTHLDDGEELHVELVSHHEALAAIRDKRICDGKTIATLLYYDKFVCRQDEP